MTPGIEPGDYDSTLLPQYPKLNMRSLDGSVGLY